MPLYDYRCETCTTEFEARRPVEERDTAVCPKCGGMRVTRPMPLVVTYVKSAAPAPQALPEGCCGGAQDGAACGCACRA